ARGRTRRAVHARVAPADAAGGAAMNAAEVMRARSLAPVLAGLVEVPSGLAVSDLALDSGSVTPGGAFLACGGRHHHGLEYAEAAVARGARVILWESAPQLSPPPLAGEVAMLEVPALREKLGQIADRFYESPSAHLAISAVTGTNGKTTTAWLTAQALGLLGAHAAYLGTLGVGVPGALQSLSHTTPDVLTLHRLLARLYETGSDSVAMEVSSHALDQERCAGVRLQAAAFTNLTRDHLDYHSDMS